MNLCLLWGIPCIFLTVLAPAMSESDFRLHGEDVKKVEIGFDLVEGNALITYNDQWKTRGKISYAEKKKIVAYRDDEIGHCLLEKITNRKQPKNGDRELTPTVYRVAEFFLEKVKAEKLGGKELVNFCAKYPISLLEEHWESEKLSGSNGSRVKRESDVIRGNESNLSHQEISKKLLEDLANAEGLLNSGALTAKGIKRNANGGTDHGVGHHPSASAKMGQPASVDYHARIRNNLQQGGHPLHPIDITSSVVVATGASHPIWSYPPSAGSHYAQNTTGSGQEIPHGIPHRSQNNSHVQGHHGHHYSGQNGQAVHPGVPSHPTSSDQSFRTSGYYPPSAVSQSQQNAFHYPPSSVSKTQSNSQYPPSSFSKPQQSNDYYPPSPASKTQQGSAGYPPSSSSKSYPPSSSSKSYSPSSVLYQPGPAYYPPSSFSKTHHNATTGGPGVHPSLTDKTPVTSQHPSSSHSTSQGYHPSYVPPSSVGKVHYSASQPQNASYSTYHPGGLERGRGVHTPHFAPSSSSKVNDQQGQYGGAGGTSGVAQYPPSSTSKLHHLIPSGGYGGSQDHLYGIGQYPPSSTSKVGQPGSFYAPQFPPSSMSKPNYSPSNRNSFYGQAAVLERPSAGGNARDPGNYPPSSTSKAYFSPQSHAQPAGGNAHGVQYYPPSSSSKTHYLPSSSAHDNRPVLQYPPSSTSKTHYLPSSSAHDNRPVLQYPPSSTSKLHYSHSSGGGGSPPQIPQPPTDRNIGFAPSSTSKVHMSSPQHPHNYPPSSSSNPSQAVGSQGQHYPSSGYYPPSSTSKVHQPHHNFSSTKQSLSPGHYSPSSTGNLHHSQIHHDAQAGGRLTATGRVSLTPGFGYYPPSSSSKNGFVQQGVQHVSSGHQQYPYYGPSSSSHRHNGSVPHGSSGTLPSSSGQGLYSPSHYPPSSYDKANPSHQQNGSVADPHLPQHSKPSYPAEQQPVGHQRSPHHNDSYTGHFPHPSQGSYPPSGHHPSLGGGQSQQYPSSSQNPQQPLGGGQTQFYQGLPPSSQGSHVAVRPCQSSPRSLYTITTRTILTPNGAVQRPVSSNGEYPCGAGQVPGSFPYARYAPCSGTLTRNGQGVRSQTPCALNGNLRKSFRNTVPGPAVVPDRNAFQHSGSGQARKEHLQRGYGNSGGVVVTNVETQTELVSGMGPYHGPHFSKLQTAENSTSEVGAADDASGPESFEENGRSGKDVELFEKTEGEEIGNPSKYQENKEENVAEEGRLASEEEVKEGDVLEPGDRILGKDGYTILDGFRGRVVSVTGQVGKKRAETGKESRATDQQESEKKSNSGQFRYSSDLGRYVKENGEKNYSNCQGEPTFTCSEFLGSNGRAKICKPNPRRNPDGSPC